MKLALAIVCSLMLVAAPLLAMQAQAACARRLQSLPPCCQQGAMPCCKAKPSSNSQPLPAVPAQTGNQSQLSFLAASAIVAWLLPDASLFQFAASAPAPSVAAASPLYARNCVFLI
jgi:hypothetical protein